MSSWASQGYNLTLEIASVCGKDLGLLVYFLIPEHPGWGEIYMVKGINRSEDGGVHGVSDACYLHIFDSLKQLNCLYVNDGELGTESGTREHKLRFKPIFYLKSYDLEVKK